MLRSLQSYYYGHLPSFYLRSTPIHSQYLTIILYSTDRDIIYIFHLLPVQGVGLPPRKPDLFTLQGLTSCPSCGTQVSLFRNTAYSPPQPKNSPQQSYKRTRGIVNRYIYICTQYKLHEVSVSLPDVTIRYDLEIKSQRSKSAIRHRTVQNCFHDPPLNSHKQAN